MLCLWLADLTCAVANNSNRAAFAASEMCGTIASSLGFLFADSASLDAKLDVAAVLCVLGFAGYFAEAAGRQGTGTDLSPGRAVIPGGFASPKGAGGGGVSAALRQRAFYAMLAQGEHDLFRTVWSAFSHRQHFSDGGGSDLSILPKIVFIDLVFDHNAAGSCV